MTVVSVVGICTLVGLHAFQQLHVLSYLYMMLVLGFTELEVHHNGLFTILHHSVRTMFHHLAMFHTQDRALVEECPVGRKPMRHLLRMQTLAYH